MDIKVPLSYFTAASEVAKRCTLLQINCVHGDFRISKSIDSLDPLNYKFNRKTIYKFDDNSKIFTNLVELQLSYGDEDHEKAQFSIKATFQLVYRLDTDPPPKESRVLFFGAFAELSGLHHCWPYWREFVDSSTRRMGVPVITSPLVHFVPEATSEIENQTSAKARKPSTVKAKKALPPSIKVKAH